jgi:hypothetical protein
VALWNIVGTSRLDATSPGTSKQFQATPGMQNAFKHLAGTRKGRRPLPDAGKVLESILDVIGPTTRVHFVSHS